MNIFERATRKGLRFNFLGKTLNTEDIWNMPLTYLDNLAKQCHTEVKSQEETSFITVEADNKDTSIQLRFDIVIHIINTKLAAKDAANKQMNNKVEREKLLRALESKEESERSSMSREELLTALGKLS